MKKGYTYLLLGSNSGDRAGFIEKAITLISEKAGVVINRSPLFETEPWGFNDPVPFLNMVLVINTDFIPETLLHECLMIEETLGRRRSGDGYSSRTIDIDILFYDNLVIEKKDLVIPHPRLHLRKFTLVPLASVAPDFIHPVLHKTVTRLLAECNDPGKVVLYEKI